MALDAFCAILPLITNRFTFIIPCTYIWPFYLPTYHTDKPITYVLTPLTYALTPLPYVLAPYTTHRSKEQSVPHIQQFNFFQWAFDSFWAVAGLRWQRLWGAYAFAYTPASTSSTVIDIIYKVIYMQFSATFEYTGVTSLLVMICGNQNCTLYIFW